MSLIINSVENKGNLTNECVLLKATGTIPDLSAYIITDNTYVDPHRESNEWRHTFWFPSIAVAAGEWVRLWSKAGRYNKIRDSQGFVIHELYWKLGHTVWNQSGDTARLFNVSLKQALGV